MEAIRSRFFNGMDGKEKKLTLVNWKNVLASKDKGGLGVSSFYALNRALLFKWVWRFRNDNNSLWAKVIMAVHGSNGSIGTLKKSSQSSTWLDIVRVIEQLNSKGIHLINFIKKKD